MAAREPVLGKIPTVNVIFTPEGRMMVVLKGEGREAPTIDQNYADLFKSKGACTGIYRIEGEKSPLIVFTLYSGIHRSLWMGGAESVLLLVNGTMLPFLGRLGQS